MSGQIDKMSDPNEDLKGLMFPVKGEKLFQPWTTWNKSSRQSGQTDLHELQNSSPVPLSHSSCITTVVIHHDARAWLKPTWLTNIVGEHGIWGKGGG